MVTRRITLILNNNAERERLQELLTAAGCEVTIARDGTELLGAVAAGCDAAIVDTGTVDLWDAGFVRELRARAPDLPLVLASHTGRVESYVAMLSTGAWDYLARPFSSEAVEVLLRRVDEQKTLLEQNRYLWAELEQMQGLPHTSTRDPRMVEILRQVSKVAQTDASVLILGEPGTEKTAIARLIHNAGPRKPRPFIHVNCGVAERSLAERLRGRQGNVCSLAAGGTVLLDEVTAMSPHLQATLLRILEDDSATRFICTSSKDPYEEIEKGRFRSDLFFRLNSSQIFLPPLRERAADIPVLAGELMDQLGVPKPEAGWDELADYDWPGNFSELEAAVRLAALRRGDTTGNAADALLPRTYPRRKTRRRFPE